MDGEGPFAGYRQGVLIGMDPGPRGSLWIRNDRGRLVQVAREQARALEEEEAWMPGKPRTFGCFVTQNKTCLTSMPLVLIKGRAQSKTWTSHLYLLYLRFNLFWMQMEDQLQSPQPHRSLFNHNNSNSLYRHRDLFYITTTGRGGHYHCRGQEECGGKLTWDQAEHRGKLTWDQAERRCRFTCFRW